MTPFGEAVRALRQRKGVSQKEMAAALGVSILKTAHHGITPRRDLISNR